MPCICLHLSCVAPCTNGDSSCVTVEPTGTEAGLSLWQFWKVFSSLKIPFLGDGWALGSLEGGEVGICFLGTSSLPRNQPC